MAGWDRQPGLGRRETRIVGASLPDHRRAAAIPPLRTWPEADADGVAQILIGKLRLLQPEFLTLIEADRAAEAGEQHDREFGHRVGIAVRPRPAADMTHHVMVGKRP